MAKARKTPAVSKSRKPPARKGAVSTARKPPARSGVKITAKRARPSSTKLSKIKKYSPRSRYATFRIGDRLAFNRIQNWQHGTDIENVVGTVVDKIFDKANDLKFIEVQFEMDDEYSPGDTILKLRRFVVK